MKMNTQDTFYYWTIFILVLTITESYQSVLQSESVLFQRHVYDPTTLRSLRTRLPTHFVYRYPVLDGSLVTADEQTHQQTGTKRRKRGRKGGVKVRLSRRPYKPALPIVITGNARSLTKKHDELVACTRYMHEYRNASIICFSESWLNEEKHPDSAFEIDGYTLKRCDRDIVNLKKSKGGGVCAYINNRWSHENNIHVIKEHQTKDCEILCLSIRPYYLPREFTKVILNVVYIPCDANSTDATTEIDDHLNEVMTSSPDAIILTTGDFNHRTLDPNMPFYQHVTCPTRVKNTIDLFYSNIANAYTSKALPPIGSSDHNMLMMMPKYKTKLMTNKKISKTVAVWNNDSCQKLQGCFECTDWDVFYDSCDSLEELNDVVTSYIRFCQDTVLEKKAITIYPNNKPWVTKEFKILLNDKKRAFMEKNEEKKKQIQKKIKQKTRECKYQYKRKIEENLAANNPKDMWDGMKTLVGYNKKKATIHLEKGKELEYANELNSFYNRFDQIDFKHQIKCTKAELNKKIDDPMPVSENDVKNVFRRLKEKKACGPDKITPRLLKTCSDQLSGIFTIIFNMSLTMNQIPEMWKISQIIPVPKCANVKRMNDLRPVALTSVLMKCMERIVLRSILVTCESLLDPLQFAYKARRGVEDAVLHFTNNLYRHLDKPKCYSRVLFIDFSSAFNTIQPHLLIPKILDLGVAKSTALWVLDFLTNRTQYVRINTSDGILESSKLVTNTGAPQGTVLAPVLFSIYTNDCQSVFQNIPILKYADDTAIQGLIENNEDLQNYNNEIARFVNWCNENFLHLNVQKTKEMIFDFRINNNLHNDTEIKGEIVERVNEYKYLGVVFDEKLDWRKQSNKVLKRVNSRMYFLRQLSKCRVETTLIKLFFDSCIKSLMMFCLTAWGGNLSEKDRIKFDRIFKYASKLMGHSEQIIIRKLYEEHICNKLENIIKDEKHPLNNEIIFSKHSGRIIHLKSRTERYRKSFLPTAIRIYKA